MLSERRLSLKTAAMKIFPIYRIYIQYTYIYIEYSHPQIVHIEKSFRNLIKLNRNQIVITMHRLIWIQQTDSVRLLFQINRKIVYTVWYATVT